MVVALELWFRVGVTRCHTVRLDYRSLRVGAGMKPATIRQALWALHESQLVTVTPRGDGRKLEVRVHEVAPAPTGVRWSLPRRAPWKNQDPSEVRDG